MAGKDTFRSKTFAPKTFAPGDFAGLGQAAPSSAPQYALTSRNFQLTFNGVPLCVPTPEILARVSATLWQDHLQETMPRRSYPGRNMFNLATPFPSWPPRPFLNLGDFYYPTGMSRWAEYHGICTQDQLFAIWGQSGSPGQQSASLAMRNAGGSVRQPGDAPPAGATMALKPTTKAAVTTRPGGTISGSFTIADDGSTDPQPNPNPLQPGVTTTMYLLPPKPLSQVLDNVQNDLYLITLVDERYYLINRVYSFSGSPFDVPGSLGTHLEWTDLINAYATDMGITLNYPNDYDSVTYGKPAHQESAFWSQISESSAILLDAAAWNVGCGIARNLDGTYNMVRLQNQINTEETPFTNAPTLYPRPVAGGTLPMGAGGGSVLPSFVRVTFPFYLQQVGYLEVREFIPFTPRDSPSDAFIIDYPITVLPQPYSLYQGAGIATIHDSARAYFVNATDTTPANVTQLQTLAFQLAIDFCANLLLAYDVTLPHIVDYQPGITHDIIWTLRSDFACTRIYRKPWNMEAPQMQHAFQPTQTDWQGPNAQPETQVVTLLGSPDAGHYNRYNAQLERWSNISGALTDWRSAYAFQVGPSQALAHWVGNDPTDGNPVYAFSAAGGGAVSLAASCYIALIGASPTTIIWKGMYVNGLANIDNIQFTNAFSVTASSPICSDPGNAHQGATVDLVLNAPTNPALTGSCYIIINGNHPAQVIWKGFDVKSNVTTTGVDNLEFDTDFFTATVQGPDCSDTAAPHAGVKISVDLTKPKWQHNLLSATHPDTAPFTPPGHGDLVVGDYTGHNSGKWEDFAGNSDGHILYLMEAVGQPVWYPGTIYAGNIFRCTDDPGTFLLRGPEPILAFPDTCYTHVIVTDRPPPGGFDPHHPNTYGWLCISIFWKGMLVNNTPYIDEIDFDPADFDVTPQTSTNCPPGSRDADDITYSKMLVKLNTGGCQIPAGYLPTNGTLTLICSVSFNSSTCALTCTHINAYMCKGRMYTLGGGAACTVGCS